MFHFLSGQLVGLVVGWVIGCFTPGIGRIVKGWVSRETAVIGKKL
jgi:hypothetical protein